MEKKVFPTHIVAVDGVIEKEGDFILLVRNRHNGLYTVPGGQVEVGETLIEALCREIQEETGANIEPDRLICVSSNTETYPGYGGYETVPTKVVFGFKGRYLGGTLHTSNETSEVLWVPRDKVLDYITMPVLVERFQAYLHFNGAVTYIQYVTRPEYTVKSRRMI